MSTTINLQITFESLTEAIKSLDLTQKQQLLEILEQQIFQAEETSYQDDEETLAGNISINAGKEAEVNLENEPALVRKHRLRLH
ncbi:MAG: hypothetical protein PX481_27115 [Microcystis sp. M53603_WE2]|jgi:hypothetical protein|uniref:hypothetical protein n=1 Tax=unclassified Microcystis TaxID=2643300 RepID=UPI0022C0F64C|nr:MULTISPECIES: hypothetical protein [unclassified Microcystis]MCZ8027020.1 hypothetical protein [Microcystis sp. LE19-10.1B]MDJ0542277.1 hypothetical protein [Microcystis sp. M53603_WE2]MDJ0604153.1 hypothetical protein [Microcystis sp. M53602_WE12]